MSVGSVGSVDGEVDARVDGEGLRRAAGSAEDGELGLVDAVEQVRGDDGDRGRDADLGEVRAVREGLAAQGGHLCQPCKDIPRF